MKHPPKWAAEALHDAARFCRKKSRYEKAYMLATKGLAVKYPQDGLFVRDWIYIPASDASGALADAVCSGRQTPRKIRVLN